MTSEKAIKYILKKNYIYEMIMQVGLYDLKKKIQYEYNTFLCVYQIEIITMYL